jgi:menaquinone-specific isochorismate synthase
MTLSRTDPHGKRPTARPRSPKPGASLSQLSEAAGRLSATTREVDPASVPDLVRAGGQPGRYLWGRSGQVILGSGEALRLPLPAGWAAPAHALWVRDVLSAIHTDDDLNVPASGPVAIGALPYDPTRPGHLSIPRLVVVLHRGVAWATMVRSSRSSRADGSAIQEVEGELRQLRDEPLTGELPDRFELGAILPHADWKKLVTRAVEEMESGSLSKVVLARQVEVLANRSFVVHETLARLASLYPSCAVFHMNGFVGASPETLLRRTGPEIESHPLAGTVARSGDPATDEALVAALMSSSKDRREHRLVVEEIVATLGPLCASLEVPDAPSVMPLRNVSHLGTEIKGRLLPLAQAAGSETPADGRSVDGVTPGEPHRAALASALDLPTSLEIAALLQPTPAVGGLPVDAALRWQRENEGFDRGCYAGPVGWVDSRGDGEWVLGLRCATISGRRATLYAGNGIVAGSDPEAELGETQLKLQALLAALVRP